MYRNAKLFFANEFKSAKDVIQYDDRGEGKLVGKGLFHIEDGQFVFLDYFTDKRDMKIDATVTDIKKAMVVKKSDDNF